jgi:hypothetical protein
MVSDTFLSCLLLYEKYLDLDTICLQGLDDKDNCVPGAIFFRAFQKKKKLLILDLNGVLADTNNEIHSSIMADGRVGRKLGKYIYPISTICTDTHESSL